MEATTLRRVLTLLLSAVLLTGLMVPSAVAIAADEEEEEEAAIGMDALSGLGSDEGGGDTSETASTGNLNNPLGGGSEGTSDGTDGHASGSGPGTTEGSDPSVSAPANANPMFKLMTELILSEVQAAEADAAKSGTSLSAAERAAIAKGAARDLITFMQQAGLLGEGASGDMNANELFKQIDAIPTTADPSPKAGTTKDD